MFSIIAEIIVTTMRDSELSTAQLIIKAKSKALCCFRAMSRANKFYLSDYRLL